jgi:succinate dehydrogenase hydrophobic anchor subunit
MKLDNPDNSGKHGFNLQDQYLASLKTRSLRPWEWVSLRFSGLFLIIFVGAHLWLLHSVGASDVRFGEISLKLRSPFFVFLDLGLLALAVYHGLVGLVRVIVDLGVLGVRGERVLRWIALAVGSASLLLGYRILSSFLVR